MFHKHHIVPKHMGGTDDEDNLVTLSIKEHAEAHRKLYEEHGKQQDYIAWQGLLGQIDNEEIQEELSRAGGLNNKGIPKSEDHKANISASITTHNSEMDSETFAKKVRKISNSMKGNTNSQNHSSKEYKKKQSEAMKAAWTRRKRRNSPD